jgi:hypothetical protein
MKHASIYILAAALLSAAGPAAAADTTAEPVARCKALLGQAPVAPGDALTVEKVTAQGEMGCRFSGLRLKVTPYQVWTVETLTLDRLDFGRLRAGSLPTTLSARAEGIRFSVDPEKSPAVAYQMKFLQKPFEITLDYNLDPETRILAVKDFTMQGERIGRLSASEEIGGVDPSLFDLRQDPPEAALLGLTFRRSSFSLDNHGLIEGFLLMPFLGMLPDGMEHPEEAVAKAKEEVSGLVRQAMGEGLAEASGTALLSFIADFPQPKRPITITAAPSDPVPLASLAAMRPDDTAARAALGKSLNVSVTY